MALLQTGFPGVVGQVGCCKTGRGLGHRGLGPGGWSPQVVGPEGACRGCEYKGNKAIEGIRRPWKALQTFIKPYKVLFVFFHGPGAKGPGGKGMQGPEKTCIVQFIRVQKPMGEKGGGSINWYIACPPLCNWSDHCPYKS